MGRGMDWVQEVGMSKGCSNGFRIWKKIQDIGMDTGCGNRYRICEWVQEAEMGTGSWKGTGCGDDKWMEK